MCKYCDYDSDDNVIFIDPLTNEWYMAHRTDVFDQQEYDWVYERIYINYCPYCGRELNGK